jgi:hypothetical protein
MMNLTQLFKRLSLGIVLASVPLIGGCGDSTITWQEEVKLLDGRVITITQKRRYEMVYTGSNSGNLPRDFWLIFKLPEFANQEITWHENLEPRVLNVYRGKFYLVGIPFTEREFRQYGSPRPSYLCYRYDAGKWQLIPFNEIPVEIYDTNLLIANEPPNGAKFVSFAIKAEEMKDDSLVQYLKRIDPKHASLNY